MNPIRTTILASLAPFAVASAQSDDAAVYQRLLESLIIPIHTADADAHGGAYGTWAGADDYKVQLADGFTFHPRLGAEAPRSLPFRWRTDSIRVGDEELVRENPSVRATEYRYQIDYGSVSEAYDIKREGVEQSWTLRSRPAARGDVVVTGVVTSELECSERAEAHQALQFCQASKPIVEYGRAFAFDARGERISIETQFDGERIRLRVPQEFVDRATFPLTIDPLTSTVAITSPNVFSDHTIVSGRSTPSRRVIIAYCRRFSVTDFDAFAVATNRNFSNPTVRFADMTTGWSTDRIDAAYCGGADAWALGFQRSFPSGTIRVRAYVHQMTNLTMNSGTTIANAISPSSNQTFGSIGGSWTMDKALLTFRETSTTGGGTTTQGVRLNAATPSLGARFQFVGATFEALSTPEVIPSNHAFENWVVAIGANSFGVERIKLASVTYGESASNLSLRTVRVLPSSVDLSALAIAGVNTRYTIGYITESNSAPTTEHAIALRFDWPSAQATPVVIQEQTLGTRVDINPFVDFRPWPVVGIAHDLVTQSHWAIAVFDRVFRLGYTGGITESGAAVGYTHIASADSGSTSEFLLASAPPALDPDDPLLPFPFSMTGQRFTYSPNAISVRKGSQFSCAGPAVSVTNSRTDAGTQVFSSSIHGIGAGTNAFYLLGFAPTALPLDVIGMIGCSITVEPSAIVTFGTTADVFGSARISFALADSPVFLGDLHSQWFYVDPTAAPLPLRSHDGFRHQIR